MLTGGKRQSRGDATFSGAAVADQKDVFTAVDIVAPDQFPDQLLVDRWLGREVERVQCFDDRKPGRLDPAVCVPVDLHGHPLVNLHKHRIRIGRRHHEERQLPQPAGDVHQSKAAIDLGLTGTVNQRYEDLLALLLDLPDRFGHLRVAAAVAFLPDPLEDPLGRMPLLPGNATVLFQDLPEATESTDR